MTQIDDVYITPIVNKDFKGVRIDKFLSECLADMSRSRLQKLIEGGNVVCDDVTIADNAYKVKEGESFAITLPEAEDALPQPEDIPLEIVYQDEAIIVVNKPAGMVVHPAAGVSKGTLVNALLFWCHDLSGIGGVKRPGIVHRIDKETSGLLVVAKNDNAHRLLCEQFAEHSIDRTYYAFCYGVPAPLNGVIEGDIGRSPYDRKKMAIVQRNGKRAVTHYQVVENYGGLAAKVKCNLETGRTHQIRVHLASKGNNLLGDKVYTKSKKINDKKIADDVKKYLNEFPRQALHAQSLGFVHPISGEKMYFESELPDDLQQLQKVLQGLK